MSFPDNEKIINCLAAAAKEAQQQVDRLNGQLLLGRILQNALACKNANKGILFPVMHEGHTCLIRIDGIIGNNPDKTGTPSIQDAAHISVIENDYNHTWRYTVSITRDLTDPTLKARVGKPARESLRGEFPGLTTQDASDQFDNPNNSLGLLPEVHTIARLIHAIIDQESAAKLPIILGDYKKRK